MYLFMSLSKHFNNYCVCSSAFSSLGSSLSPAPEFPHPNGPDEGRTEAETPTPNDLYRGTVGRIREHIQQDTLPGCIIERGTGPQS